MEDFPKTLAEFEKWFRKNADCREYLFRMRWSDGFRCPRCNHGKAWPVGKVRYECTRCGYQASVIAGTILQDTHKPLTMWFRAMWWVTSQKTGASALGLQRVLGLGSYQTAWTWLHKLRRAMVRPGRDRLAGRVEVDETYVGGVDAGGGRRHLGNKALVAIAAQVDGKGIGRVRLSRISDASAECLGSFVSETVEPKSTVITDGWPGYEGLSGKGYKHHVRPLGGNPEKASKLLPRVHRVASLLKRWLMGTHQGAVSREHLDYYLDEFTFRFNRRASKSRGKLFYRLVQQALAIDPVPYAELRGGSS